MNTNRYQYRWTSFAASTSRDGAHAGARASRPHTSWHNLGHLLRPARPATAPGPSFGRAHTVPAGRVAGCPIEGELSGTQRQCMRAGRPRSRVGPFHHSCSSRGHAPVCRAAARSDAAEPSCLVARPGPSRQFVDHSFSFVSGKVGMVEYPLGSRKSPPGPGLNRS